MKSPSCTVAYRPLVLFAFVDSKKMMTTLLVFGLILLLVVFPYKVLCFRLRPTSHFTLNQPGVAGCGSYLFFLLSSSMRSVKEQKLVCCIPLKIDAQYLIEAGRAFPGTAPCRAVKR